MSELDLNVNYPNGKHSNDYRDYHVDVRLMWGRIIKARHRMTEPEIHEFHKTRTFSMTMFNDGIVADDCRLEVDYIPKEVEQ